MSCSFDFVSICVAATAIVVVLMLRKESFNTFYEIKLFLLLLLLLLLLCLHKVDKTRLDSSRLAIVFVDVVVCCGD